MGIRRKKGSVWEQLNQFLRSSFSRCNLPVQDSGLWVLRNKVMIVFFCKAEIMKGKRSLRPTQAQSTKEKRGVGKDSQNRRCLPSSPWGRRWWIPSMERLQQKPRKLRAGQDWPWWARKDDLVHHCGGKCSLGKRFFSLQPADFSCSCYTTSFQKYEGL